MAGRSRSVPGRSRAQRAGAHRRLVDREPSRSAAFGPGLNDFGWAAEHRLHRGQHLIADIGTFARGLRRGVRMQVERRPRRRGISAGGVGRRGSSALRRIGRFRLRVLIVDVARWRRDHDRRRRNGRIAGAVTTRGASARAEPPGYGRLLRTRRANRRCREAARSPHARDRWRRGALPARPWPPPEPLLPAARREQPAPRERGPE